jgi:hypothetical protein
MNKVMFLLAALLSFGATGEASASPYKGYWYGAQSPQQLANIVEAALKRDPTGATMLSVAKCKKDGSCASATNYLESFKAHDPEANLKTVAEIPAYLRSLEKDCSVSGKFQMDRIVLANGKGRADVNGMSRALRKGECAWVNKRTGRVVLAPYCANPIGRPLVAPPCAYVDFEVRDPREANVHYAVYGPYDDVCFGYRSVAKTGEPDSAKALWLRPPIGCPLSPCDFSAVDRAVSLDRTRMGTIQVVPGHYQFRVSRKFAQNQANLLALCVEVRDGQARQSSFTNGVRPKDYRTVGGVSRARVHYVSFEKGTDQLFFWAATDEEAAQIKRGFR